MNGTNTYSVECQAEAISLPTSASVHFIAFSLLVLLSLLAITGLLLLQY